MVLRIGTAIGGRRRGVTRLPAIGRAGDYQPVQSLHLPAAVHQLDRQPIEQLRMRRRLAVHAEIVLGGDERDAKMPQPDVIHGHSGSQRVFAGRDPPGKRQPSAGAGGGIAIGERRVIGRRFRERGGSVVAGLRRGGSFFLGLV